MFDNHKKDNEKSQTEKINDARVQLKKTMQQNLKRIGFSNSEIKEVMEIITDTEQEIQMKKDALVGTNINNDHVGETMQKMFYDIRQLEFKMAADIRAKIAEIKARKR